MMQILNRALTQLTLILLRSMSPTTLEAVIRQVMEHKAATLSPKDALRLFFRLDNAFYETEGALSIRYGDGQHTKHRHTRYHDFFTQNIAQGARVLDVGCGTGTVSYALATLCGATVVGVDINTAYLEQARQRHAHSDITYQFGDILKPDTLAGQTFDAIVLSNVLEHLPDRPQLLRRLAAETGATRLLIRVPSFERDWRVPLKQEIGVEWRLDLTHETEYTVESFQAEMQEAGLTIENLGGRWGEIWAIIRA